MLLLQSHKSGIRIGSNTRGREHPNGSSIMAITNLSPTMAKVKLTQLKTLIRAKRRRFLSQTLPQQLQTTPRRPPSKDSPSNTLLLSLSPHSRPTLKITPRSKGLKQTKRQNEQTNPAGEVTRRIGHIIQDPFQNPSKPKTTLRRYRFHGAKAQR